MGLGGTAKKLQKVSEMADDIYSRMNELRERVERTGEAVEETNERVAELERQLDDQRALLTALAHEQGVDVDAVLAEAAIEEAEPERDERADDDGSVEESVVDEAEAASDSEAADGGAAEADEPTADGA
jgi:DNA anti-recombination protein RmuC